MMSILVAQSGTQLRAYEEPMLEKHFGEVLVYGAHGPSLISYIKAVEPDYIYWRPDTERTTHTQWTAMRQICRDIDGVKHINHPHVFDMTQCKDHAWRIWGDEDIPVVPWLASVSDPHWERNARGIKLPCLLRLNNSTSAHETVFVETEAERNTAIEVVSGWFEKPRYGRGVDCSMVAQQFIETLHNGYRWSYRIIVAGSTVVTGYARPAKPPNWVATMAAADWTPGMAEVWLDAQIECERWMHGNASEIIKAVKVLGLDFQGVDVIRDRVNNRHYYLEVQPGFAVGYLNQEHKGWHPPYYNPSKPESFVKWLITNHDTLRPQIPLYYDAWLDKERLFDSAFEAIKKAKG